MRRIEPTKEWGDGADWFVIEIDGRQVGNGFVGHQGAVASFVLISGLYSSDAAMFEQVLEPKLRKLASYDPLASHATQESTRPARPTR